MSDNGDIRDTYELADRLLSLAKQFRSGAKKDLPLTTPEQVHCLFVNNSLVRIFADRRDANRAEAEWTRTKGADREIFVTTWHVT